MKLTNYIIDLGRIVAFHPNLKRVTGSITATLLLSQLIYWIDKTDDGWIYKDSYDLEEETGLSVYEQQTARKALIAKGILEENYKRLDHKIAFRIKEDALNDLWEQTSGKMSNPRYNKKEEEAPIPVPQPVDLRDFQDPALHPEHPAHNSAVEKKGDLVDGLVFYANSPGAKKEAIRNQIMDKIETRLHINVTSKRWTEFIDYAYTRQEKHKEPIDKFIDWMLKNNPNPSYWTPDRFLMFYPQAFANDQNKPREDFVAPLPEREQKKVVPMPEDVKKKKNLT
jgi:hypothetical protein